jgi:hypothetical protein
MEMAQVNLFCTTCHEVGPSKSVTKGSILVELFLWLCFLFPGLLYSIWRLTSRHKACRACGGKELVPTWSERARLFQRAP